MVKDIDSLELSSDLDLIYFYKNIAEYSGHLDMLSAVHVGDVTTGMICYGFVEDGVVEQLGLEPVDCEMVYLMEDNRCRLGMDADADEDTAGEEKAGGNFVANLPVLLSRLLCLFDKQIEDIIFIVYRKTGTNHFEEQQEMEQKE